jgi:hypothetical protein
VSFAHTLLIAAKTRLPQNGFEPVGEYTCRSEEVRRETRREAGLGQREPLERLVWATKIPARNEQGFPNENPFAEKKPNPY